MDQLVPGDSWFVIDGDILLDCRIDVKDMTPVHARGSADDPTTVSVKRYVDKMLGTTTPILTDQSGQFAMTSCIPFRYMVADTLKQLRNYVSDQLGEDLIEAHIRMFYSGEIVAVDPTATLMVMHEWELIEAYNQMCSPGQFPIVDIGSGYHLDTHTSSIETQYKFRVNPYADSRVGQIWYQRQHLHIPDALWEKASKIEKTA